MCVQWFRWRVCLMRCIQMKPAWSNVFMWIGLFLNSYRFSTFIATILCLFLSIRVLAHSRINIYLINWHLFHTEIIVHIRFCMRQFIWDKYRSKAIIIISLLLWDVLTKHQAKCVGVDGSFIEFSGWFVDCLFYLFSLSGIRKFWLLFK